MKCRDFCFKREERSLNPTTLRTKLFQYGDVVMTPDELKALKVGKLVDAHGTVCPGPLLEARRGINECPVGVVMEIQSSDADTGVSVQ